MSRRVKRKSGSRGFGTRTIRRGILLGCFMGAGSMIMAKAAHLQVFEYERWASAAEDQHRERLELPARRGAIFDRNGVPLALSHEMFQVSVAPGELRDPEATAEALREGLGLSAGRAKATVDRAKRWVVIPGRYTAEQRQKVGTLRGVYFDRHFDRFYPQGDAGREVIGAVTRDGRPLGGMEQQLNALLSGEPGYSVLRREAGGELQAAISLPVVPPTDGASVYLTIDFDIQEIADEALRDAMRRTGASGGDLMIGDPKTGEILAAVSRRAGRTRSLTAITEPYEPGSTLKPFLVATLMAEGRAALSDSVFAEKGTWQDGSRTFRDTSPHEWLSLAEALEVSSNIAFVKFAKRLSSGQQYAYLRDFGLGTATGIEYPSESTGWLRKPSDWSRLSSGSLAMGYELSVTPLQMLSAYGALANGGVLMEPYLVREVRASDGRTLDRRPPTPVRQVVPNEVAQAVTGVLASVVEAGTASRAALSNFSVAGKTGTSRRTSSGGGYAAGSYTSTFVGFFPAEDPQIVIFVKLDEPKGEYYGGLTAAPVTRETLQGILATRTTAIDGRTLLATRGSHPAVRATPAIGVSDAPRTPEKTHLLLVSSATTEPEVPPDDIAAPRPIAVPELTGLDLREAAKLGHDAGFQVRVRGSGSIQRSDPPAGKKAARGSILTLVASEP